MTVLCRVSKELYSGPSKTPAAWEGRKRDFLFLLTVYALPSQTSPSSDFGYLEEMQLGSLVLNSINVVLRTSLSVVSVTKSLKIDIGAFIYPEDVDSQLNIDLKFQF